MTGTPPIVQRLRNIEFGPYAFDAPVVQRNVREAADTIEALLSALEDLARYNGIASGAAAMVPDWLADEVRAAIAKARGGPT